MCIGDEDLSSKRINTFITIIWTQSCLLLSDDVCLKEIATTSIISSDFRDYSWLRLGLGLGKWSRLNILIKMLFQGQQYIVVNCFLLKCRKLRREDQETSDWIVSRILLLRTQAVGICSHRNLNLK